MRAELHSLAPLVDMVAKIDTCERFLSLDIATSVTREGTLRGWMKVVVLITELSSGKGDTVKPLPKSFEQFPLYLDTIMDWDLPLRIANQRFDRLVSLGRISDVRKRRAGLRQFEEEVRAIAKSATNGWRFPQELLKGKSARDIVSNWISDTMVLSVMAEGASFNAQDRADLLRAMDEIGFGLAAYRADHGQYPDKLDELTPKYLSEITDDTFTDKPTPIRYRREGEAYVMWTVHLNGIDDDGRTADDDPAGDDYVLRPVPKVKVTQK